MERNMMKPYGTLPPLMQQFAFEFSHYLPEDLLVKVDMMSMRSGLEIRVPFLDHRMVEWAVNLPARYKINAQHILKWLPKKALCRYLPEDLVFRKKQGFSIPLAKWLRRDLAFLLHDHLSDAQLKKWPEMHTEPVRHSLQAFQAGDDSQCHRLWSAILLSRFLSEHS